MGRRCSTALVSLLSVWLSACAASAPSRPATTAGVRHASPTAVVTVSPVRVGPVPEGFDPVSASVLTEREWWLLGERPCSSKACLAIARTTDGGRNFVAIPAPALRSELAGCPYVAVSALAFADARDGYAYGCRLYSTHDAGLRWRAIDLGGYVTHIAAGDGEAYAIVASPTGTNRLMRSSTTHDDWVTLPTGANPENVTVRGRTLFVGTDTSRLLISHDQGSTFSRDNAVGVGLPCAIQPITRWVVWAFCSGGMMGGVLRSVDGGRRFRLAAGGTDGAGASGEYHAAVFAAASASTAVVGFQQLLRTTDGGRRYEQVGPRGQQWTFLAFTDPRHGVALQAPPVGTPPADHLYVTADAGRSFTLIPIRSAALPHTSRCYGHPP